MIWVLGLHGLGSVGTDPDPAAKTVGLGGTFGVELHPQARVELLAQGAYGTDGRLHGAARPELRVTPLPHPDVDLALTGGYGVGFGGGVQPVGSLGLSAEMGRLRLDARWLVDGITPDSAQVAVGWTFGRPESEPVPEVVEVAPEPIVEPVPEAPALDVTPDDAMVWIPHPWCRWMAVEEAQGLLAELPEDVRLHILAGGYVPETALVGGDLSRVLSEAPEQASLVVAAHPADIVEVDGTPVPLQDGTLVATVPLTDLVVTVSGGGRTETHELSPANGYALWLRVSAPEPLRVQFPVNSSTLQPAQRDQIEFIAEHVGDWSFQVQGGASPEGDPVRNLALANARGEAVAKALIEAGLPADRVTYLPSEAPTESDQDFEWLRFATITPIEEAP